MSKRVKGNLFHLIITRKGEKQLSMVQMETCDGAKLKFKLGEVPRNDLAEAFFSQYVEIESDFVENGMLGILKSLFKLYKGTDITSVSLVL